MVAVHCLHCLSYHSPFPCDTCFGDWRQRHKGLICYFQQTKHTLVIHIATPWRTPTHPMNKTVILPLNCMHQEETETVKKAWSTPNLGRKCLWLSMEHDGGPSLQFLANLEKILSFLKFWLQNRFFCPTRRATWCMLTFERSYGGKLDIFGFFMKICAFSRMAEIFHQVMGGLKGQKHLENGLSATLCTSRNQSWEITVLEGQMNSKLKNSTWVG